MGPTAFNSCTPPPLYHDVELRAAVLHAHLQRDERQVLRGRLAQLQDLQLQRLDHILAVAVEVPVDEVAQVHVHAPVGLQQQLVRRLCGGGVAWREPLVGWLGGGWMVNEDGNKTERTCRCRWQGGSSAFCCCC
jgi:hypothetical protein